MALEDELNGHNNIAQFLEKFKEQPFPKEDARETFTSRPPAAPLRPAQYARSFEKLEQKIHELEEKFEASTTQNQLILSELARTREAMERQKDKDAFLEHLSRTIATLRTSVENLSQAQQTQSFSLRETNSLQRSFDPLPTVFAPTGTSTGDTYAARQEAEELRRERDEQTRLFNSLRQKASQLKAVNSALDREIKKAQLEKMDALKKSADQAKEILSLRDQLNAAEERFKSFDFEGRIISIKKEYQQKVTSLETQLKEMSDTCMKQVEEIESLKAENTKLQTATAEKESLQAQLADKEKQLADLKNTIAALQTQHSDQHEKQLAAFTAQLRTLEEQRDRLAVELEQSQISLETMRREKDLLEKNFKELVVKINQNDTVISQLKQKIDVLGQQNAQLSHHNEELTQTNTVLSHDNQALSQTNVELTHRNAALTQHNVTLTRHSQALEQEKNTLTQRVTVLGQQAQELSRQTQELGAQKTDLSKQVEELNRTNENLSKQTQTLGAEKTTLAQHVAQLHRTNETLSRQARALGAEKQTLSVEVQKLSAEKQALAQDNEHLNTQRTDLEKRTSDLENQAKALSQENAQLRNQSAALLAARLVQQHAKKEQHEEVKVPLAAKKETLTPGEAFRRPVAPVLHSLGRTISAAPTEDEWEVIPAKRTEPARTSQDIKSEADLPEIKVADPIPQNEPYDGEDFLEKTDSFIGRMKWSIFRENR